MNTVNTAETPNKWLIFVVTSLLLTMANIDMTAVNLALPSIAHTLNIGLTTIQWLINAYTIGGAALVILGGRLGDALGDKFIFMLGVTLFTLASVGVGFSAGKWSIIAARLIQGFGAALAWPLVIVMNRRAFGEKQKGFIMGLTSAVMGMSMAIGPPIGGVILHLTDWRWIFFVNLPIGITTLILASFALKNYRANPQASIHIPSAILFITSFLLVMYALNEAQSLGLSSLKISLPLFIGIICLGFLYKLQKLLTFPLIDFKLFADKVLTSCFIIRILWQILWIGSFFVLSLLLQNIYGFSTIASSIFFLSTTVAFAITSPICGHLSDKISGHKLIIIGLITYIVTYACFLTISLQTPFWAILIIFILLGIGTGIGFPALLSATLKSSPKNSQGMVSGIFYACLFTGSAFGAIVSTAVINITSSSYLQKLVALLNLPSDQLNKLRLGATGVRNIHATAAQFPALIAPHFENIMTGCFLYSFDILCYVFIFLSITCCVIATQLKNQ